MNIVDQRVKSQKKLNYNKCRKRKNDDNNSLKVVYISSPMKVKTSASRFRSLVQQLTGKNSDISQYMDDNNKYYTSRGDDHFHEIDDCAVDDDDDDRESSLVNKETSVDGYDQKLSSINISPDDTSTTTTSSYSFFGLQPADMESVFIAQMKEQLFEGIFASDSFYNDPSQMDVLASFDELL